jgi:hypothetical protein
MLYAAILARKLQHSRIPMSAFAAKAAGVLLRSSEMTRCANNIIPT